MSDWEFRGFWGILQRSRPLKYKLTTPYAFLFHKSFAVLGILIPSPIPLLNKLELGSRVKVKLSSQIFLKNH